MSVKYVRKTTVKECAIHKSVLYSCKDKLIDCSYFEKKDVIESLGYIAIEDSIRWDYIADFLTDDFGYDLVPLAQRFFNKIKKDELSDIMRERKDYPGRFIASGHGKKTVGYANVTFEGGAFALKQLENRENRASGMAKANYKLSDQIDTKLKGIGNDVVTAIEKDEAA